MNIEDIKKKAEEEAWWYSNDGKGQMTSFSDGAKYVIKLIEKHYIPKSTIEKKIEDLEVQNKGYHKYSIELLKELL